jgi:UDP-2,3-diacylglucosamine pyrophosphatase LpxH
VKNVHAFPDKIQIHAAWLSDIHLGYKDCKAKFLLDFLDKIDTRHLYLVGDIIDLWSLDRQFHWPAEHSQVVRKIMKMAREGVRVTYIPGNHDITFREYCGESFGAIQVQHSAVHTTLQGKRLLVLHGDEFDEVIRFSRFVRAVGDSAYDLLLFINRINNALRRHLGYGYWSLATHIKQRIANAAQAIQLYEDTAVDKARREGYDGIVCGHIHHPNVIERDGIIYCNDGDWVENCTTLVEKNDGVIELWHWSDRSQCIKRHNGERIEAEVRQLDLLKVG